MSNPSSAANQTARLRPYLSPLAVWALSVGSAIGWGSLVVPAKTICPSRDRWARSWAC